MALPREIGLFYHNHLISTRTWETRLAHFAGLHASYFPTPSNLISTDKHACLQCIIHTRSYYIDHTSFISRGPNSV
ncbi:predicted protein [Botrytis cinerea T4]|uniref:Uncharacterized protein n=1 Tax=Botryotinia fuckeliana (strain T4) TaxID=999810 RepID=G2Y8A5_BOTF4|nr:predicted protein [Botrytis cinerea T4]